MTLSKKDLDHVLELAHLELVETEKEAYLGQLDKILDFMKILNKADVSNVKVHDLFNENPLPLREDKVINNGQIDLNLNSKHIRDNSFYVPKILGE